MRRTSSIPGHLVVGVVTLLLSVACEPLLPTPGTQALPTVTPIPIVTPLSATPTVPTSEIQARPIHTPAPSMTFPSAIETPAPSLTVVPFSPTQVIQEASVAVSPTVPMPSSRALQELVMQAKEDLAGRLSLEADKIDQIDLIEIKAVVWPDSSLGCPQPGMAYTQVQQDGLRIRLRVGKRIYSYHSGGSRLPFLCEQATKDDSLTSPGSGSQ
jgi:hypothetical protein